MGEQRNVLDFTERERWYEWLARHFDTEREAWLLYANKASGGARIQYNDAVEVALCFGWIDSTVRGYSDTHRMQRFTPRRARSGYSQANIERLRWLHGRGLLHPSVAEAVSAVIAAPFVFPPDIIAAIERDEEARRHYRGFSAGYRRIRIAYIEAARSRPVEFQRRLANFVAKTRAGKRIAGYGGIDKHY